MAKRRFCFAFNAIIFLVEQGLAPAAVGCAPIKRGVEDVAIRGVEDVAPYGLINAERCISSMRSIAHHHTDVCISPRICVHIINQRLYNAFSSTASRSPLPEGAI